MEASKSRKHQILESVRFRVGISNARMQLVKEDEEEREKERERRRQRGK